MIKKLKYISLLLVLSACADVGDRPESVEETADSELIADAKMFMEEYSAMELDYTLEGLHPGAYSPVWNKAVTFESDGFEVINVPISSEATYEATMYTNPDEKDEDETYHTAIAQKLVIQREMSSGVWSCFMLSLIPDASCSTDNRMNVSDMFVCGSDETKFSGIVVYSTVTTNFTAQIDIYTNGKLQKSLSVYNGDFDWNRDFTQMSEMIPIKSLTRNVRAISRSGDEFGGWGSGITLPEIVVPGGGSNGGGTGGGDIPSLPNPPSSPGNGYPNDPGWNNYPPSNPPRPGSGSGNGSGGGSSNSGSNKYVKAAGDKLVKTNIKFEISTQVLYTCVATILDYANSEIFGANDKSIGDFVLEYALLSGSNNIDDVLKDGVNYDLLSPLLQKTFNIENCSNVVNAIDNGYSVLSCIIGESGFYHNVLIVGYRKDGTYIYMDSAKGYLTTAHLSKFILYRIILKSKK